MAENNGVGSLPRFDCTHTKAQAVAAAGNEPETVFFTTVDHRIVKGGVEYGGTTAHENRITALEGQVPTASAAATAAAASADAAASSAENAEQYLSDLQSAIQSLPGGADVSAQVALMQSHKAEIIDIRSITTTSPNNTIKDSNGNAIDAGRCLFVYSKEVTGGLRYYACETVAFTYMSTNYTVVKFKTATDQAPYYTYWVFQGPDTWLCIGVYNENTLPSYLKHAFISDELEDTKSKKADKVGSATNGHLAGLNSSGNITDSGIAADKVLLEAFAVLDWGEQSTFAMTVIGSSDIGYYTVSDASAKYAALNEAWTAGKIPVVKVGLSNHTSSYVIPLFKGLNDTFFGSYRKHGKTYSVEVDAGSSSIRIYTDLVEEQWSVTEQEFNTIFD